MKKSITFIFIFMLMASSLGFVSGDVETRGVEDDGKWSPLTEFTSPTNTGNDSFPDMIEYNGLLYLVWQTEDDGSKFWEWISDPDSAFKEMFGGAIDAIP